MKIFNACDIVCHMTSIEEFKKTPATQKIMDDLVLATHLRAIIAADKNVSDIDIEVDGGVVTIGGTIESILESDSIKALIGK